MKKNEQVNILGTLFHNKTMSETVNMVMSMLRQDREETAHIITANPEMLMIARSEPTLQEVLAHADIITPDGIGIVWASRILNTPIKERVAGYDLLHNLCEQTNYYPFSVFLLGAKEEVNKKAAENLSKLYPNLKIVGRKNGYFKETETDHIVEEVNKASPDLLLVALGVPKQELWIYQNKKRLNAKVAIGVGGSFDVLAGYIKRAPLVWQNLHIEWLYRLLQEPSRWKRQLQLPKFMFCVVKEKITSFRFK
ncbi:glycosyl transferase, WecB/TagA/CpsF family [Caldalkalibacillus thermarum TA2.A1]|uniref:N-acetylglucosaminyldiphosphoundecaprenol N-acetyl-beta-D-mannosaminyltransferase n=1 Tax=Caldalkalibacillus thermarum (strain TA2.A1) TaxID=986075 RepID=F5L9A1_CALTT|nr:WecB/TagA/CpsF family glycosyltransferase [Caldalkalibacillus thermarum]EGL82043.1 glycosyl transferase, WecB/TagA/CpsF family [Caldalkalibacillus thermarum TA2.A1]